MSSLSTPETSNHVSLCALPGLVAHLVALETKLSIAGKTVVGVLAAQDAVHTLALIWAFHRLVAELFASMALDRRVFTLVVSRD